MKQKLCAAVGFINWKIYSSSKHFLLSFGKDSTQSFSNETPVFDFHLGDLKSSPPALQF